MTAGELDAALALAILASQADGSRSAEEGALLARTGGRLGVSESGGLSARAERGELTVADAVAALGSAEAKRHAYEMAVSVIYADGDADPRERGFLDALRSATMEDTAAAEDTEITALGLGTAPLGGSLPHGSAHSGEVPRVSQAGIPAMSHDAALDDMILRQALLTGALELLPQNLASMAIIPIQMRLVYRIGADYGQALDAAQIKDLLGAMGIGAVAQVLDGVARRIVGGIGRGVLGRVLGGIVGGAAGAAAGAGMAFVATYALGHAARQYYAQGRVLSGDDLRALFAQFTREGETILPRVQEELHLQAQRLDLPRLLSALRGG